MGNESLNSKIDINYSRSDSDSFSNCADNKNKLEEMADRPENRNEIIKRVWIAKKAVTFTDEHFKLNDEDIFDYHDIQRFLGYKNSENKKKFRTLNRNIFTIKKGVNLYFKHWAILLELSNFSYVIIQFGKNGFALKEFDKTEINGENLLNSIIEIWGEQDSPLSFDFLGITNYDYEALKKELKRFKTKEEKKSNENNSAYYNLLFYNCQHFSKDIEKYIYGAIQACHKFNIYLDEFFKEFFPNIDMIKLKLNYETNLKAKNERIFKKNLKNIPNDIAEIKNLIYILCKRHVNFDYIHIPFFRNIYGKIYGGRQISISEKEKNKIKKLYCLNIDDFFIF